MKTEQKKSLALFLLNLLLIMIMLCSCGTRKKALQAETVKKEVVTNEKKDIVSNAVISTVNQYEVYTPIDHTKPMITPDGKSTTNAIVKKGVDTKKEETKTVDKGEVKKQETVKKKKKVLDVETKKPNPWLWIGLVIILCFISYLGYRKLIKS